MLRRLKRWYHRLMRDHWKRRTGTGAYYRYIYHERKAR